MKTLLFLALTLGWSVLIGILLRVSGIAPTSGAGTLILAVLLMPSPAVATCVVHHFRWNEIIESYGLNLKRLNLFLIVRSIFVFFLSFALLYLLLVFVFGNVMGLPGVGTLTFSTEAVKQEIARVSHAELPASARIPPVPVFWVLAFAAPIIAGFTINGLFAFGEELGWRGFLWQQLRGYGVSGKILLGVIWGLWHAPIILLGYNFPLHPYLGVFFMVLLTVSLTFPLTDIADRTGSVYAPSIIHGMFNACGIFGLLIIGESELVGTIMGVVGCAAILLSWLVIRITMPEQGVVVSTPPTL